MLGISTLIEVREDLAKAGRELEELADRVQAGDVDAETVLEKLNKMFFKLDGVLRDVKLIVRGHLWEHGIDPGDVNIETTKEAIESARMATITLEYSALVTYRRRLPSKEVDVEVSRISELDWQRYLEELDFHVYRLTDKHCARRGSNKLSSILKDLASCIHAIADHLAKIKIVGKCAILDDSKEGRAFCLAWSKAVEENKKAGLYDLKDYYNIEGWVVDDRVRLTLGMNEKAFVYLGGELEFLSDNEKVRQIVKDLLEEYAGLDCSIEVEGDRIYCRSVTDKNMKKVALVLSIATSMDERLEHPYYWWSIIEPDEELEVEEKEAALKWLKKLEKKI